MRSLCDPPGRPDRPTRALERLEAIWHGYWPEADTRGIGADIERRLAAASDAWRLSEVEPVGEGNVALVCWARRGGESVVLKLNPRCHPEEELIAAQARALEFWAPTGSTVRLLDQRDGGMTLLLERVEPGGSLDDEALGWEEKLAILGGLVARLHDSGPAPPEIPSLSDYAPVLRDHLDDPGLLREFDALLADSAGDVLLHGDLHPGNALRGADRWTVIDPTALRGDRHADIWALICPQAPGGGRFRELAELYAAAAGLDAERAMAWARVRAGAECSGWLTAEAIRKMP
jgi:streptomycin 6-kinase